MYFIELGKSLPTETWELILARHTWFGVGQYYFVYYFKHYYYYYCRSQWLRGMRRRLWLFGR
jgi:hypothetical protein